MRRAAAILLLAGAASAAWSEPAAGQWRLRVDRASAEAGASFDGSWLDVRRLDMITAETYRQWIRLRFAGHLRDPRILTYDVVARPMLVQGQYLPVPDTIDASGRGSGLLGALRVQLFRSSPVWGQILANRSRESRPTSLGGRSDQFLSSWSVHLFDRNPLLPMEVSYRRERRDLEWVSGAAARRFRSDERTSTFRLESRNSRTTLVLERLGFNQAPAGLDFVRRLGLLGHDQRWGAGSRLRSTLRYVDRTRSGSQSGAVRSLRWREAAHLQQSPTVATDLAFGLARTSGGGGVANQADARGTVSRTSESGFTLAFDTQLQSWQSGPVSRRFLQAGPRTAFGVDLPLGLRLTAAGGVTAEVHGQGSDGESTAEVVQEPHVVGQSRQFLLARPFADPTSVLVTSQDGGTLFEEGLDYRLFDGEPFLVVVILPGGRIEDGETVLVDYRYDVAPAVSARSITRFWDVGLSLGGLRVYQRERAQHDLDEVPSGVLPVLRNYGQRALGVEVSGPWTRLALSAGVERREQRSDDFHFDEDQAHGNATLRVTGTLWVTVSGRAAETRGGNRPFRSSEIRRVVEWRPRTDLRIRTHWTDWDWVSNGTEEHFDGFGGTAEWRGRGHMLSLRWDHVTWVGGIDRTEDRVSIELSRTFGSGF